MQKEAQTLELISDQPKPIQTYQPNPGGLLEMAIARGADLDQLERLMKMKREYEADEARKAFVAAMAEFKKNPPVILKQKKVAFGNTKYMHATIGAVTQAVTASLAEHGISHRWETHQEEGGRINVVCTLTHRQGHSESASMFSPPDTSGQKNSIQAIASTVTYLQRYTLLAATGVATHDMADDDGKGGPKEEFNPLTQPQQADIEDRIKNAGIDRTRFFRSVLKVEALDDIDTKFYTNILGDIENARKAREAHLNKGKA